MAAFACKIAFSLDIGSMAHEAYFGHVFENGIGNKKLIEIAT